MDVHEHFPRVNLCEASLHVFGENFEVVSESGSQVASYLLTYRSLQPIAVSKKKSKLQYKVN